MKSRPISGHTNPPALLRREADVFGSRLKFRPPNSRVGTFPTHSRFSKPFFADIGDPTLLDALWHATKATQVSRPTLRSATPLPSLPGFPLGVMSGSSFVLGPPEMRWGCVRSFMLESFDHSLGYTSPRFCSYLSVPVVRPQIWICLWRRATAAPSWP